MSTVALPVRETRLGFVSTDHKRVAARAGALAFVFFIAGGVLALVMRTQLAADGGVVSQNTYDQLFTMHGSTMIYLFVVPVALASGFTSCRCRWAPPRWRARGRRSPGCGCSPAGE